MTNLILSSCQDDDFSRSPACDQPTLHTFDFYTGETLECTNVNDVFYPRGRQLEDPRVLDYDPSSNWGDPPPLDTKVWCDGYLPIHRFNVTSLNCNDVVLPLQNPLKKIIDLRVRIKSERLADCIGIDVFFPQTQINSYTAKGGGFIAEVGSNESFNEVELLVPIIQEEEFLIKYSWSYADDRTHHKEEFMFLSTEKEDQLIEIILD